MSAEADATLEKLKARVAKRRRKVEETLVERGRLKWFLVLAFTTWPIGLFFGLWLVAWIFFGWLTFFAVGAYMNFFHLREALARLAQAEAELFATRQSESAS